MRHLTVQFSLKILFPPRVVEMGHQAMFAKKEELTCIIEL